jgi:Domain of unknown function (DUF4388)
VSWMGRLDEVSIPDLLHLVSWGEKTGKLVLVRQDAEGLLVFRKGKIIYAASNSPREALGHILVCKKLIGEETLVKALEQQHAAERERRLGAILIENGAITGKVLERVIREQIEKVMAEFFLWQSGFFRFEAMDIPETGEPEVDARDFLLQRGFNTEQVVLEVVKRVDEARKRRDEYAAATRPTVPHSPGDSAPRTLEPLVTPRVSTPLSAIMAGFPSPTLRGEATLSFLRHAATRVLRGVLFIPGSHGFAGTAEFGIDAGGSRADEKVRNLVVPRDHPSILADVMAKKSTYRGMLPSSFWNDYLIRQLGGRAPREVIVVPAVIDRDVVAIFYGDNLPSDTAIGPATDLEAALVHACLSQAHADDRARENDPEPLPADPTRSISS